MDPRPGGPTAERELSPEGLGINTEGDLSAMGAAPNLNPFAPVSLGAYPNSSQGSATMSSPPIPGGLMAHKAQLPPQGRLRSTLPPKGRIGRLRRTLPPRALTSAGNVRGHLQESQPPPKSPCWLDSEWAEPANGPDT